MHVGISCASPLVAETVQVIIRKLNSLLIEANIVCWRMDGQCLAMGA